VLINMTLQRRSLALTLLQHKFKSQLGQLCLSSVSHKMLSLNAVSRFNAVLPPRTRPKTSNLIQERSRSIEVLAVMVSVLMLVLVLLERRSPLVAQRLDCFPS
jgi:hypothetical protein